MPSTPTCFQPEDAALISKNWSKDSHSALNFGSKVTLSKSIQVTGKNLWLFRHTAFHPFVGLTCGLLHVAALPAMPAPSSEVPVPPSYALPSSQPDQPLQDRETKSKDPNKEDLNYRADRFTFEKVDEHTVEKLEGNVMISTKDFTLYADTTFKYPNNKFEAQGNVRVIRKNNTTIFTNRLYYDHSTKVSEFFEGVTLVEKKEDFLTAQEGQYRELEDTALFKGNVKFENKKQTLQCQLLAYGPLPASEQKKHQNLFNTKKIPSTRRFYTAEKQVVIFIKEQKVTAYGQYCLYDKEDEKAKIYGNAVITKTLEKEDTMHLLAEEFILIKDPTSPKGKDERILLVDNGVKLYNKDLQGHATSLIYSTQRSQVHLEGAPVFWNKRSQFSGQKALITIKDEKIERMDLGPQAIIGQEDAQKNYNQLRGDAMVAFFKGGKADTIILDGNAESIYFLLDKEKKKAPTPNQEHKEPQPETTKDNMHEQATLGSQPEALLVQNNPVSSPSTNEEKEEASKLVGLNHTKSATIKILIKNDDTDKIIFTGNPQGVMFPPKSITLANKQLKGFVWREKERPTLMDVENRLRQIIDL